MALTLEDVADESHDLPVNWWTWRPALALIEGFGILDEERLAMMGFNGTGVVVSQDEARAIADAMERRVLATLKPGERVRYDMTITDEPDDGTFHRDDLALNYSAHRDWLTDLVAFCRRCGGFTVV